MGNSAGALNAPVTTKGDTGIGEIGLEISCVVKNPGEDAKEFLVMKRSKNFVLACLVFSMMTAVLGVPIAEAEIRMTFVNKTDRVVSVATYVYGSAIHTKGWYNVQPGKLHTVTIGDIPPSLADSSVGYYAVARKKGAKTIYWRNQTGNWESSMWAGYIHPTKSFDTYEGGDGFQQVGFRSLPKGWKKTRDLSTISITLAP
jgi:uncharacterized membrane protein